MPTTIVLVRHGQTEWNRIERFRGQIDIALNATGLEQARQTAQRVCRQWSPSAVYASPMKRAIQTAEPIAALLGLPIETEPRLTDINYGEWHGLTPEEARAKWPGEIEDWYHHPERATIARGEKLAQVQGRAMAVISALGGKHPNETITLVSHTVVNRLILLGVLGIGLERFWHLRQEPCAINLIEVNEAEYTLCSMNDTCHLMGE